MNIVYVLELFYPNIGGVEKLFFDLAERNALAGNNVKVVTTRFNQSIPKRETVSGFEIIRLNLRNRFLFTFFGYCQIKKHIRNADIVHTTSYNAALPAYYASKRLKKKCIITYHEVWIDLWKDLPGISFIEKFMFRKFEKKIIKLNFDCFAAPSIYTELLLKKHVIDKNKVKLVYNGINYPESNQRTDTEKKYIYFGRAGISKGIEMLINAAAVVNRKYDYTLYILIPKSNNSYRKKLEKIISDNMAFDHIKITDSIPDQKEFHEFLKTFSFSVIPSVSEGFCFSAAESVSIGLPVISSGRGALSEVVSGKHITMQEYSAGELANCIERAIKNEWNESEIIKFEAESTFKAYSEIYKELISG